MFRNKFTILITVGVLIAITVGLQFIKEPKGDVNNTIKAIPEDAAIVFETNNFVSLLKNILNNNQFKQEFEDVEQWKDFFNQATSLDSLLEKNKELKGLIEGKKIFISGHIGANNHLEYLYVLNVKEKHQELLKNAITSIVGGETNSRKRLYEEQILYDVNYSSAELGEGGFTYAIIDEIFIFSFSRILIEDAVRRLKLKYSLAANRAFMSMAKTAGKNVDVNIYLNYDNLPFAFKNLFANQRNDFYDFFRGFAEWTELDLIYKNDAFVMSGFTIAKDSVKNYYLNIFKGQEALNNDFLSYLPGNTSSFIAFNFSDAKTWKRNYFEYLQKLGDFPKRNHYFEKISAKYKMDITELFYNNIDGGICITKATQNLTSGAQEVFTILQIKDIEVMEEGLNKMKQSDSTASSIAPIQLGENLKISPFPEADVFGYLFGSAFNDAKSNYYLFYNGNLIFSESPGALQSYLRKVKTGLRLIDDKQFINFSNSLASKSNIYAYLNFTTSKPVILKTLNEKNRKIYDEHSVKFSKIQGLAVQYGLSGDRIFTNLYANFNPKFRKKTKNIWELHLDKGCSMKPTIVKNHYTGNNEVLFQDEANRLVLVSSDGKVLWKKKIGGKILGEIHQVDKYKNNKLQYIFNTSQELFLVDRNGKDVDGFPIKFKSPATNGIAIFDYENKKDYRVVVACANKSVYLLSIDGGRIDGWEFGQTTGAVRSPVQHFISHGKDYIIFADETKTYIVNRRGETRVVPKASFGKSKYNNFYFENRKKEKDCRFVTTGNDGTVYFIYLDGVVKKMTLGKFSDSHRFEYEDIDGDGTYEFIYTDEDILTVFNSDKSTRFKVRLKGELKNSLNLYQFGKKLKYIGVSPFGLNKIYLIHPSGKVVKGFPMHGNGPFSIANMNPTDANSDLSLITINSDNFLFNYRLDIK